MLIEKIDLSTFEANPDHFGASTLLLTVKSFDLQAIRKRYLKSKSRSKSGSVERREPALGGLVLVDIANGKIQKQTVLAKYTEARGIDVRGDFLAVSSENKIYLFQSGENHPKIISHPWLSYIHTVKFSKDCSKILVASSGVDSLLEFDVQSGKCLWEWLAWEHGLNRGENPETGETHVLTRRPDEAQALREKDERVLLIDNPAEEKLPTALRAAFMNSAEYDSDETVISTFFHFGDVRRIDKKTFQMDVLIDGLQKPHGGMRYESGYLVTDTAGGRIVLQHDNRKTSVNFSALPGKSENVRDLEWLQTSHWFHKKIVTIDSNRTSLTFSDLDNKKRMHVSYDPNWAVQDFIFISPRQKEILHNVQLYFQKKVYEK